MNLGLQELKGLIYVEELLSGGKIEHCQIRTLTVC